MQPARTVLRAQRAVRLNTCTTLPKRSVRFQSQQSASTSTTGAAGGSGAITGGLVGGGAALAVVYAWYHFSGARSAVQSSKQAKQYVDSAVGSLKVQFQDKTPDTDTAIQTLRESANKWASFVPGGREYVDKAFQDLEAIRQKHGDEVNDIVREAYGELRDVSKKGLKLETASETWNVLSKHLERLASLAGDAGEDILNNHPQLKEKLGGSTEQLKQLGQRLGPEAKKQVDETWKELNDLVQQGVKADTVTRAWSLLQDKIQKIKQLQQQAYQQGYEQLKPLLEKNPQVKKVVEENAETIKNGNVGEAIKQVQQAVSTGNTQDLEKYIQQAKDKAQQSFSSSGGGQLQNWINMVPGGSEILSKLQNLQYVAENHGQEAEQLAKETMNELKQVLDKKTAKAQELSQNAKKNV